MASAGGSGERRRRSGEGGIGNWQVKEEEVRAEEEVVKEEEVIGK